MFISTFFSYKGGAGRSTTCFNTVPFLVEHTDADAKHPILLMDTDIESAGMTFLLNQQDHFKGKYDVKQFLKCEENFSVSRMANLADHPLYNHFVPVGNMLGLDDNNAVMFFGVDVTSEQLNRKDVEGRMDGAMERLITFADNNNFKGIVMDSAAGDQFSAILSVDTADKIVFCLRMTHQFRVGTFNYLHKLALKYGAASDKEIIILPTVVPADAVIDGQSQMQASIEDINARIDGIPSLDFITDFVEDEKMLGINEIMRFKWKEGVLYKLNKEKEISDDEKEGLRRYSHLAEVIAE